MKPLSASLQCALPLSEQRLPLDTLLVCTMVLMQLTCMLLLKPFVGCDET